MVLALAVAACSPRTDVAPDISVKDAWARATVAGQQSGAAYLTIVNRGGADRLVSVDASQAAQSAGLHSSSMAGGVMRMRPLRSLDIPAQGTVKLEPSGTHIMMMGLKGPLQPGRPVELELRFEKSRTRTVPVQVVRAQERSSDG
jgi:periplasmic copper chaperone A